MTTSMVALTSICVSRCSKENKNMLSIRFTGLDRLASRMSSAPRELEKQLAKALGRSIAMAETESKRRTPVDTGYLRSSIGGAGGFSFVRGFTAGVGTNVNYAIFVHERIGLRHPVGGAKFMEKGAKAALPFINKEMEKVAGKVALYIVT